MEERPLFYLNSKKELSSKLNKEDQNILQNPYKYLLLCIWQDKGAVRLLSNIHQPITKIVKETRLDKIKYPKKPEMAIEWICVIN